MKFKVINKHFELCYLFERRARPLCDVVVPRTLSDASLGQWEPRLSMIMKLILRWLVLRWSNYQYYYAFRND